MVVSRCLSSATLGRNSTCSRFQQAWCSSRSATLAPSAMYVSTVRHWSSKTEHHPRQGNRRCRFTLQRPVTSLLFGRTTKAFQRPWHDPEFMQGSSPEELEEWLLALMQSTRQNADKKGIATIDHSRNTIVYFDKFFASWRHMQDRLVLVLPRRVNIG